MSAVTPPGTVVAWGTPAARWVLAATVGGSGLALLDATTVTVALPTIGAELDASLGGLQWTVNAYTLSLASLILLAGSLSDRFGRRRIFLVGVAWFAVASVLCAAAPTIEVLILARALQGVGGALLTPGSLAILQASFAPRDRGRAIGAWAGLGAIAGAIGPLVGGWLVATVGWRWIFWMNLPLAAVVLWLAFRHVPESRGEVRGRRFDVEGAVLATLSLAGLTWALIEAGERGLGGRVVAVAAAAVVGLAAFLVVERRAADPMLPLGLFASRQFSVINAITFLVYGAMAVVFFLLMVHLQVVLGFSPLAAGLALLPVTLLMLAFSARAGAMAERLGPRRPLTVGPMVMALGLVLLARLDATSGWSDVLGGVVVFGAGLTTLVAPLTASVLAAAGEGRSGVASGVNNAVSRTAGLLAVAAVPGLVGLTGAAASEPSAFRDGFAVAMRLSALAMAAGGLLAWVLVRDVTPSGTPACPAHDLAGPRRCPVTGAPLEPDVPVTTEPPFPTASTGGAA